MFSICIFKDRKWVKIGEYCDARVRSVRRPKWGRPSKENKKSPGGKPTKTFVENVMWGAYEFDEDFGESLVSVLEKLEKDTEELKKRWLSILEKIVSVYKEDETLKEFFPQGAIHEECGWSHEGGKNFM